MQPPRTGSSATGHRPVASGPLHVLIVDDDAPLRALTARLLRRHCDDVAAVELAADLPEAIAALRAHRIDVVLLDIELRGATGFQLVEYVDLAATQIVFVTAHLDYAVEAFRVQATDYLVRPLEVELLRETMARVRERRDRTLGLAPRRRLTLPNSNGRRSIAHDDILYLEADGSYTTVVTAAGEALVVRKLGQLEDDLSSRGFFRCHRDYVVNVAEVRELRPAGALMSNGREVPVSRARRGELEAVLGGQ